MTENEVQISTEIGRLEQQLQHLYSRRAGLIIERTMTPEGPEQGWCVSCGQNVVRPIDGFDTCDECVKLV